MKFIKICAIKKNCLYVQRSQQTDPGNQTTLLLLSKPHKKTPPIVTTKKEDFDALKSKELFKKMMWNSRSMSNHLNGVGFHRTLKSIILKKSEILFYNQTNRHLDSILNYEYVFILFAF